MGLSQIGDENPQLMSISLRIFAQNHQHKNIKFKVDFPTAFMQNPTSQPSTILKLLQPQGGRTNASASVRCLRVPQTLDVSSLQGAASRESWIVMDPIGKLHNKIILDDFMIRSIYVFLLFPSVHCCFKQNTSEFLKNGGPGLKM